MTINWLLSSNSPITSLNLITLASSRSIISTISLNAGKEATNSPAPWIQLDINPNDLKSSVNKIRTYSVIVHEYFHVYQNALSHRDRCLSENSAKWLVEGGAKVLEEIYSRQYYKKDLLKSDIQERKRWSIKKVTKEPHLYEQHKTTPQKKLDSNYACLLYTSDAADE